MKGIFAIVCASCAIVICTCLVCEAWQYHEDCVSARFRIYALIVMMREERPALPDFNEMNFAHQ